MKPKILNVRMAGWPENAVYIGRSSPWGNPLRIGRDGNRERVMALYRDYLLNSPGLTKAARRELKGKDLLCHCKPLACHGDLLIAVANNDSSTTMRLWLANEGT